jgi:uncharacterized protein YecE (DUF72 family)
MEVPKIHIGTSGWRYEQWAGQFYPDNLPEEKWLSYYSERFPTVEINSSFYRLPSVDMLKLWRDTAPRDFVFSIQASRYVTHSKKLTDPGQGVEAMLKRLEVLRDGLGPFLFQLPPNWGYNGKRLRQFFEVWPETVRCAFEFRDASWINSETLAILSEHDAAFCIYDVGQWRTPCEVTADFVYLRLHGPGEAFQGKYEARALGVWADAISAWSDQGKEIFCYFENDRFGQAAQNALELWKIIDGRSRFVRPGPSVRL